MNSQRIAFYYRYRAEYRIRYFGAYSSMAPRACGFKAQRFNKKIINAICRAAAFGLTVALIKRVERRCANPPDSLWSEHYLAAGVGHVVEGLVAKCRISKIHSVRNNHVRLKIAVFNMLKKFREIFLYVGLSHLE